MQEILYEDGTKTKKLFDSFLEAIDNAKEMELKKPIKKVTITKVVPKKRK
jgi:hypothetical protein